MWATHFPRKRTRVGELYSFPTGTQLLLIVPPPPPYRTPTPSTLLSNCCLSYISTPLVKSLLCPYLMTSNLSPCNLTKVESGLTKLHGGNQSTEKRLLASPEADGRLRRRRGKGDRFLGFKVGMKRESYAIHRKMILEGNSYLRFLWIVFPSIFRLMYNVLAMQILNMKCVFIFVMQTILQYIQ